MPKYLDVTSEEFNPIFDLIKRRYLSSNNFPKLIIGSGLSVIMGVPGMRKLTEKLEEDLSESCDQKDNWKKYSPKIKSDGLEAGLLDVSIQDNSFIIRVKEITAKFILTEEYKQHQHINLTDSGFEQLLKYLANTVSVNNSIIDIMTPNYDRIIELICDKLRLTTTTGFLGEIYQYFDPSVLDNPYSHYNKEKIIVRIFKPHGSINWINENNINYLTNDYEILKRKSNYIDIIAPGRMKYEYGMINDTFRCHRETFNKKITAANNNFSLFIYGYGFNDEHFNTVFKNTKKDVLVLSRSINSNVINKAFENKNWTLFYRNENGIEYSDQNAQQCFMVYQGEKYKVNKNLWDIDVFVNIFIG